MKDVVEAVNNRIQTPYFGYSILAFFALNWRGFFYLALTKGEPGEKLAQFDSHTDLYTLIIFPLAIGALIAASAQWLKFLFALIEKKPKELVENLQLDAEHNKTIKQTQQEQARSELFAVKEQELIERAKRDEVVADIEDSETKEKLISQLNSIRNERDKLSQELEKNQTPEKSLSQEAINILMSASKDKKGMVRIDSDLRGTTIRFGKESVEKENKREFMKYEAAIGQLAKQGLIKNIAGLGHYELTLQGWDMADKIQQKKTSRY